jgi:hypothetical protein
MTQEPRKNSKMPAEKDKKRRFASRFGQEKTFVRNLGEGNALKGRQARWIC